MSEGTAYEGPAIVEWRLVVGFEHVYEVSDHGVVRRTGRAARNGEGRGGGARIGRALRWQRTANGYPKVQLWRDGKPKMRLVHVLVAEAFLGPIPEGKEVNHKDGDKSNPRPINLEYVTRSENMRHSYSNGLRKPTVDAALARLREIRSACA